MIVQVEAVSKTPFEERFVAFVGILGFSDIVKAMGTDPTLFTTIRDALATIDDQARQLEKYRRSSEPRKRQDGLTLVSTVPFTDVNMTAFSDCYLISERAIDDDGDVSSPWRVMAAVQALGSHLLASNIFTRGAVVRGQAYHQGRVAFGPAIIEAYKIERDVAMYPRILVTEEVREAVALDDDSLWDGKLLIEDTDGCRFVNILTPPLSKWATISNPASGMDVTHFLNQVRNRLLGRIAGLNGTQHSDLNRLSKTRWLCHHFNTVARPLGVQTIPLN